MGGPVFVEIHGMARLHGKEHQADGSGSEIADDTKLCVNTGCSSVSVKSCLRRHSDDYYCEKDLYVQIETMFILSLGCFYYRDTGSALAKQMLKPCAVGTFIVRDSADHKYLYTLSVKTKRGPTSIRICYENGRFSLDADEKSKSQMPKFLSLMELIDFYVRKSMGKKSEQCRFLDKTGKKDLPILLSKPKLHDVPTLKHLTRTRINRSLPVTSSSAIPSVVDHLPLPKPLQSFIKDYPFLY